MRDLYLIGAGQTPFGSFPDRSYRDLFGEAYQNAVASVDDPPDPTDIDEAVIGTLGVGGRQLGLPGPAVTEHVGLHNVPCSRIENACAAGGAPPEFVEQQAKSGPYTSAIVALDGPGGDTVSVPAQVVGNDESVSIGDSVEATIRRVYTQEAVTRYGFKMRPVATDESVERSK